MSAPPKRARYSVDWFKRSIDVITLIVIIGGLVLGIDQAKKIVRSISEAERGNDLTTWNSVSEQWLIIDKLFIDHPELRPYVYGGQDIRQTDANYSIVLPGSVMVLDFMDYAISTYKNIPGNSDHLKKAIHPESWAHYFGGIFGSSPLICRLVLGDEATFGTETVRLAHQTCKSTAPAK